MSTGRILVTAGLIWGLAATAQAGQRQIRVKLLDGHCMSGKACHNPQMVAVEKAVLAAGYKLVGFGKARNKREQSQVFYQAGFEQAAVELARGPLARWVDPTRVEPWKWAGRFDLLVVVAGQELPSAPAAPAAAGPEPTPAREQADGEFEERGGKLTMDGVLIGGPGTGARLGIAWRVPVEKSDPKAQIIFQTGMGSEYWLIIEQHGKTWADQLWVVDGSTGHRLEAMPRQRPELADEGRLIYALTDDPKGARLHWAWPGDERARSVAVPLAVSGERLEAYLPGPRIGVLVKWSRQGSTLAAVSLAEEKFLWSRPVGDARALSDRHLVTWEADSVSFLDPGTGQVRGSFAGKGITGVKLTGDVAVVSMAGATVGVDANRRTELWRKERTGEVMALRGLVVIGSKGDAVGLDPVTGAAVFPKLAKPYEECDYDPARKQFICHYDGQEHGQDPLSGEEVWASGHVLGEGPGGYVYEDQQAEPEEGPNGEMGEPECAIVLRKPPDGPVKLRIPYDFTLFSGNAWAVAPPRGGRPMHIVVLKDGVLYGIAAEVAPGRSSQRLNDGFFETGP